MQREKSQLEELEMYEVGKELDNNGFMRDTLTAGKEKLNYNTKPDGEEGNIKTIINSISVNVKIRMYKKSNIKMYKNIHFKI